MLSNSNDSFDRYPYLATKSANPPAQTVREELIEYQAAKIIALTAERDALTKALLAFRSAGIDLGWGAHPKWFHLIQRCDEALAARTQAPKE